MNLNEMNVKAFDSFNKPFGGTRVKFIILSLILCTVTFCYSQPGGHSDTYIKVCDADGKPILFSKSVFSKNKISAKLTLLAGQKREPNYRRKAASDTVVRSLSFGFNHFTGAPLKIRIKHGNKKMTILIKHSPGIKIKNYLIDSLVFKQGKYELDCYKILMTPEHHFRDDKQFWKKPFGVCTDITPSGENDLRNLKNKNGRTDQF